MKSIHTLLVATLLTIATMPTLAVDTKATPGAPDLSAARAKINAKNYKGAVDDLNRMIDRGVQHADVYNLMGYSLRHNGDPKTAMTFYKKALEFDPNHKGALEYSGELYVELGDIARARQNATRLAKLCPGGCEELADLQKAINQGSARSQ